MLNKSSSKLLKGAAILGIASLTSRAIGAFFKIPFQNIAGDGAFGIYNMVYPFYTLLLVLSSAGLPITVSRFVSGYVVKNDLYTARRVLKIALSVVFLMGLISFLFLFFGSEYLAMLMKDSNTALAFRSVSFALLIVPVMAAFRGYFQGLQEMNSTGVSQVIEQIVRILTMMTITFWFVSLGLSDAWTAAGATFGAAAGSIAGLSVMLFYWFRHRQKVKVTKLSAIEEPTWELVKKILLFALPIMFGSIALPLFNIVDSFTISRGLQWMGLSESTARAYFGIYGYAGPIIETIALFASSMSAALVPSIAEAVVLKEQTIVYERTNLALRFTLLIGLPASVGLSILAKPVAIMIYNNQAGSTTIAILAFTMMFSTLNIVSTGILQGLGAVTIPAKNLLLAAGLKAGLNIIFVPLLGINGAAINSIVAYSLVTFLNLKAIRKLIKVNFAFKKFSWRLLSATTFMGVFVFLATLIFKIIDPLLLNTRSYNLLITLTAMLIGGISYFFALFYFRVLSLKDMEMFPFLKKVLQKVLPKKLFNVITRNETK